MRKIILMLLTLLVILGLGGQALAAQLPDPEKPSSITFLMEFEGTPLDGGSLTLYRVAGIGADGQSFVLVDALADDGPSLEDLQDPTLAQSLYDLAIDRGLIPHKAAIENGQALFAGLKPGVYVVGQNPGEETPGYAPIDLFLISLPQWQENGYIYDLTAAPKVPLVPAPTEPTEPPPTQPPDLPQTGQLHWPVPLMAVSGMALFGLGWVLFFGAKRRRV